MSYAATPSTDDVLPVLIAWVLVLALGAAVSLYALRAYLKNRQRSFGALAAGFVCLSVASALTWFGLWFAGMGLVVCELGSTGFTAVGFGTILYSLKTTQ